MSEYLNKLVDMWTFIRIFVLIASVYLIMLGFWVAEKAEDLEDDASKLLKGVAFISALVCISVGLATFLSVAFKAAAVAFDNI